MTSRVEWVILRVPDFTLSSPLRTDGSSPRTTNHEPRTTNTAQKHSTTTCVAAMHYQWSQRTCRNGLELLAPMSPWREWRTQHNGRDTCTTSHPRSTSRCTSRATTTAAITTMITVMIRTVATRGIIIVTMMQIVQAL